MAGCPIFRRPPGWLALLAGWCVTEIGRQPWLVYGLLRTADAASAVPAGHIALSLTMYLGLYAGLLVAFISVLFHLARQAGRAPPASAEPDGATGVREHGHA